MISTDKILNKAFYAWIATGILCIGVVGYSGAKQCKLIKKFEGTRIGNEYRLRESELKDLQEIEKSLPNIRDLIIGQKEQYTISINNSKLDSLETKIYSPETLKGKNIIKSEINDISKTIDNLKNTPEYKEFNKEGNELSNRFNRYLIIGGSIFLGGAILLIGIANIRYKKTIEPYINSETPQSVNKDKQNLYK